MNPKQVEASTLAICEGSGAIVEGHFVYARKPEMATEDNPEGWFHGDVYVNKDGIYVYPNDQRLLALQMAMKLLVFDDIQVVVGPELGAVAWASRVAESLSDLTMKTGIEQVQSAFIEKDGDGGWILRRGFADIVRGKRIALCEDVLNSGRSINEVRKAIEAAGGIVVAIVALWNRGGVIADFFGFEDPEQLQSLVNKQYAMHPEPSCPLCEEHGANSVSTTLGKGAEFLDRVA